MKLHFVDTMDQVLALALERPLPDMTLPEVSDAASQAIAPITSPTSDSPTAHQ